MQPASLDEPGAGDFHMEFDHYEEVPQSIASGSSTRKAEQPG
jgi:translation elongation factor EF-G